LIRSTALLALFFSFNLNAEPWLASRFANNCAACHSTGRVNVEAKARRCTWTCQGCHTNPNGGGLRNTYGKWNQERWLRSKYLPSYRMNKPRPDLMGEQPFAPDKIKDFLAKSPDARLVKRAVNEGFRLKETPKIHPETEYGRHSSDEETIETDMDLVKLRMPEGDPWRARKNNLFNAGLDFRYIYLDYNKETGATPTTAASSTGTKATFPMLTDIAVSAEPYRRVNLVFESRFIAGEITPGKPRQGWDEGYTSGAHVKSAYVMVDDLPFNAFVMHGLYRPMMGHYNPDHTTLFGYATGLNQYSNYKATTVGAAPRVPFFNFHYIQPVGDSSDTSKSQDQGFAVNVGGRWATYGLYTMLSYWKTTADYRPSAAASAVLDNYFPAGGNIVDNSFLSTTVGATLGRWTGTFDYTIVERDQKNIRADKGTVMTIENRVRFMRENYAILNYELLNTDIQLREGSSRQLTLGWSAFPIASVEVSILYKQLKQDSVTFGDSTAKITLAQLHLFF
jgi:hypothetical protein